MKRWDSQAHERIDNPRVDAFLEDVIAVCRKHSLSIGHEDGHGSFLVHMDEGAHEYNFGWLREAGIERGR